MNIIQSLTIPSLSAMTFTRTAAVVANSYVGALSVYNIVFWPTHSYLVVN